MMTNENSVYVGIDFGTSSIHCCVLRKPAEGSSYPIQTTILNCYHRDRLITPILGFNNQHLLYCDQALITQKRYPRHLIHNVKLYFDKSLDQIEFDPYIDCYGTLESDEEGTISYVYPYDKSHQENMSVPVATALIMREIKRLISIEIPDYDGENATISVSDVSSFLTQIPEEWNEEQVRLFQWTLQLAGFKEYHLLYENEALSYQYQFNHSLDWKEEYKDTVLFVDVGYDHSSVYVTEFSERSTRILFSQTIRGFSGYQVDRVIGALVVEALAESDVDLKEETASRRAAIAKSCEECKRFFTPDGMESCEMTLNFAKGNYIVTVDRAKCEERCAKQLELLVRLCQQAVEQCPEICSVVLEGGASRLTMVHNAVSSVIQKLDHPVAFKFTGTADEDVCRGCSIYSYLCALRGNVDGVTAPEKGGVTAKKEAITAKEEVASTEKEEVAFTAKEATTTDTNAYTPINVDRSAVSTTMLPTPVTLDENSDLAIQYHFIVNRDNRLVEHRVRVKQVQCLFATCRKAVNPNAPKSWVQEVNKTLDTLESTLYTNEEMEKNEDCTEIEKYRELESVLQRVKEEIDSCNEKQQYTDLTLFP